ncbi:MAG TPA: hypothetical protein VKF60_16720 [Myxococcota bacterium]|nr:hypothetical protein [Myxococcota bacterium]
MTSSAPRRVGRIASFALVCTLCSCITPTVRKHPELPARLGSVKKIGIMPVQATVTRVVFTGANESLDPEAAAAGNAIRAEAQNALEARSFAVEVVPLDEETYARSPDLRFETTEVQQAADVAMIRALRSESTSQAEAFAGMRSVLGETQRLARLADADVLLFARYSAFSKSSGEVAKDVAASLAFFAATLGHAYSYSPRRESDLVVGLIDAASGEVLYVSHSQGDSPDPEGLTQEALEAFRR